MKTTDKKKKNTYIIPEKKTNSLDTNRKNKINKKIQTHKKNRINFKIKFKNIFKFIIKSIFCFVLFFCCIKSIQFVYNLCIENQYFIVNTINIEGNKNLDKDEIFEICKLKEGINILKINIHESEKLLLNNPWVNKAEIHRKFPNTITIIIKERVPRFMAQKNRKLYYIDEQGGIIDKVDFKSKKFISLAILEIGPGGEELLPLVVNFIDDFNQAGFPFNIKEISSIRLSAGGGFELYWENKKLRLSVGIEDIKGNFKRMAEAIVDIEKRGEISNLEEIRSSDKQVSMIKKKFPKTDKE